MESLPVDFFVKSMQFTKNVSRDQYPSIDPKDPDLSMAGKVVIITGASKGIGARGFVPAFAKAGAKALILVARDIQRLKEVATKVKEINPSVETLTFSLDISDNKAVKGLYEKIKTDYGHADILINNAGLMKAQGNIKDLDPEVWIEDLSLNTQGTFLFTTYFLKSLPSDDTKATIINMTSGMAYGIFPGASAYSIGKLNNLQLAALVAAENPNVTAIALHPGVVMTDMLAPEFKRFAFDTPELVGGTAVWLATEKAKFLSGRFVGCNWNVDDLYERREEIQSGKLLQIDLTGTFGADQFN
ncbi:hypothetical protein B0T10DRAFT_446296 [Thelonectria olida]|uniref:NAD(P)-binding protein n=1 Tax=Thelonectria olida TaxID=1576542 RepID=A0A9P9ALB8_9HYPO|nr:hypothetical protein B0T10DRAFT_446296 [Thelonectria olida]